MQIHVQCLTGNQSHETWVYVGYVALIMLATTVEPQLSDYLGLDKIVWIIERPDNQKYEFYY